MAGSFKQYNPLYKLNMGLIKSEVFPEKKTIGRELSFRYKKFCACMDSFERNYFMRLGCLLGRLAEDFNITYTKEDRIEVRKYQVVKDSMLSGNDFVMFFIVVKILLDDIAFFTPFYYKEPIDYRKNPDIRDSDWPWSFKEMENYFLKSKSLDKEFAEILEQNKDWTDEVCNIRNFLIHRFHDLVVEHNSTSAYYGFLYEFSKRKDFIPNILTYVAKTYYRLVRFIKNYEQFFKERCEANFSSFKYFHKGVTSGGLCRTHLFFGGLGRLLDNKILIRIHPNLRGKIHQLLEGFLQEENITCEKCNGYEVNIRPTVENFVLISVKCKCGNALSLPTIVEKKFYPHFMDKGRRNLRLRWGLIPYTLDKN